MPVSPLDIEKRIKALRLQAREESQGAPFVIYALLDPGDLDGRCEQTPPNSTPFYVGQSCEIQARIVCHLRSPQNLSTGSQLVHRHIASLFAAGRLPQLAILETVQTRSQSLMAELRWGQHMLRAGYQLANNSPDFARLMSDAELKLWFDYRRSQMLACDAVSEGIVIVHMCTCGHPLRWVDPGRHPLFRSTRARISQIAEATKRCPSCKNDCHMQLDNRKRLMSIRPRPPRP